jgi:voltage-gated potassium channel
MKRVGAAADFGTGRIHGKQTPLKELLPKLERPMLCVSFVWFLVIVAELVGEKNPWLLDCGTALWILIAVYVGLRMSAAQDRTLFLKKNWLFVLAVLVSILRIVPFLQGLPLVRALTATFGLQVVWIFASADQGLRSMSRMMGRRGGGYALTLTAVVVLAGAAGMLHFESGVGGIEGIHSFPRALWWVSMQITNIGSGYQPMSRGGKALCLGISVYAAAMFGYLTAVFAALFIGHDAKDPKSEIPSQTSILRLSEEFALLRKSNEEVLKCLADAKPIHESQSIDPDRHPQR